MGEYYWKLQNSQIKRCHTLNFIQTPLWFDHSLDTKYSPTAIPIHSSSWLSNPLAFQIPSCKAVNPENHFYPHGSCRLEQPTTGSSNCSHLWTVPAFSVHLKLTPTPTRLDNTDRTTKASCHSMEEEKEDDNEIYPHQRLFLTMAEAFWL